MAQQSRDPIFERARTVIPANKAFYPFLLAAPFDDINHTADSIQPHPLL